MMHWTSGAWAAVASGFAALFTLLGAIVVIWQIRRVRKQAEEDYKRRRQQAAIDFYSVSLDQRAEWQLLLPPDRESGLISDLIDEALKAGREEKRRIIHNYLGFWELLAAAIKEGVIDEPTAVRIARGRVVAVCKNYARFVETERTRQHAPKLYCELEDLARKIALPDDKEALETALRDEAAMAAQTAEAGYGGGR
jgi:hypothetical protein